MPDRGFSPVSAMHRRRKSIAFFELFVGRLQREIPAVARRSIWRIRLAGYTVVATSMLFAALYSAGCGVIVTDMVGRVIGHRFSFLGVTLVLLYFEYSGMLVIVKFVADYRRQIWYAQSRGGCVCAQCGYDLRGLPATYYCPECGTKYDVETTRSAWRLLTWGHQRRADSTGRQSAGVAWWLVAVGVWPIALAVVIGFLKGIV